MKIAACLDVFVFKCMQPYNCRPLPMSCACAHDVWKSIMFSLRNEKQFRAHSIWFAWWLMASLKEMLCVADCWLFSDNTLWHASV